jgi:uncharacterized peroxidase-related enzyme
MAVRTTHEESASMPHIPIPEGLPGIRGLFTFRPETAKPLCELANVLLHAPGTLSPAERELIATFVSSRNDCHYCQTSHGAVAAVHLGGNEALVADVKRNYETASISDKLKALLAIAAKVQEGGKKVQPDDVERARARGATDMEIHDTVLIAAAFCMYNRYVDGLATWAPVEPDSYRERAAVIGKNGYTGIPTAMPAARAASGLAPK